jgi:outer membrane protein assembly factor BamB
VAGLAAVALAAVPAAGAASWPQAGFGPARTAFNPNETTLGLGNVAQLQERWETTIGPADAAAVYSYGATVSKGVVYASGTTGLPTGDSQISALSESTGQTLWTAPQSVPTYWPLAISGTTLFSAQLSPTGILRAFARKGCGAATCSPLWQGDVAAGHAYSPPLVTGATVVVAGDDGGSNARLWAFPTAGCGAASCAPTWTADLGANADPDFFTSSYASAVKGFVFAGSPDGSLRVFAAAGCGAAVCAPVWTAAGSGFVIESIAANGRVLVVRDQLTTTTVSAYKLKGCGQAVCQPVWSATVAGVSNGWAGAANGSFYLPTDEPDVSDDLNVFNVKGCGAAACTPTWSASVATPGVFEENSNLAIANGVVYFGAMQADEMEEYNAAGCGAATCSPVNSFALPPSIGVEWGAEVVDGMLLLSSAGGPVQAAYSLPGPLSVTPLIAPPSVPSVHVAARSPFAPR